MTLITSTPPIKAESSPAQTADAKLKKTAYQMEGLFVQRLFAAMRDTVPQDGLVAPGNGESTFTGMLDEKMAEQVPTQWNGEHSLAQALYHQLRQRLASPTDPTASATASTGSK